VEEEQKEKAPPKVRLGRRGGQVTLERRDGVVGFARCNTAMRKQSQNVQKPQLVRLCIVFVGAKVLDAACKLDKL